MRFISTRVHGVLDYLMGMVLIAAPWLLGFADNTAATWVPVMLGVGVIVYSLFTDYELGVFRGLSMRAHLWLEAIAGIFLAVSPWLFGFSDSVSTPHVVIGLIEVALALTTQTVPQTISIRERRPTTFSRGTLGSRPTPETGTGMRGTGRPSTDVDVDRERDIDRDRDIDRRGGTL